MLEGKLDSAIALCRNNDSPIANMIEKGLTRIGKPLNDINTAISMNDQYEIYYAEKASLLVRVGLYDEAIETAKECISVAPSYSDGYLFLGLAQCMKGNKQSGIDNLKKAKELGHQEESPAPLPLW